MSEYISKINKNNTDYDIIDATAAHSVNGNLPDSAGNVEVNRVLLADNLYSSDGTQASGSFVLRTTAGATSIESISAVLNSITGNGSWEGHSEAFTLSVTSGTFSVSVNNETWRSSHSTAASEGLYTYDYDGTEWKVTFDGTQTTADFTADGLSIATTPTSGDQFTIQWAKLTYGAITIPQPASLASTGINIFDKSSMVLSGYTIDSNGDVAEQSGSYVAYAPIDATKATTTTYTAYNASGGLVRVGYSDEVPTSSTTGIDVSLGSGTSTSFTLTQGWTSDENVGYICIATTNIEDLCVHPTWSGTMATTSEPYTISHATIPTTDVNGTALPTATYGIPAIGAVSDVLDIDNKTYTKKLDYVDNTPANLAIAQASGYPYWVSDTKILYQLATPVVYQLASTVSGEYMVNDYGEEYFVGADDTFVDLSLSATITYGRNLKDKLRNLADIQTVGTGLSLSNGELSSSGSGPTVVQTKGSSTTDVMSQNAVTGLIFNDPADTSQFASIKIGTTATTTISSHLGNYDIVIGMSVNNATPTWSSGVAIGGDCYASQNGVVIGANAGPRGYAKSSNCVCIGHSAIVNSNGFRSVIIGDYATGSGGRQVVVGNDASITGVYNGSIAIGGYSGSGVTAAGMVDIGSSDTGYGYNTSNYRLLTGLYDGQSAHDAATYGQLDTRLGGLTVLSLTQAEYDALSSYDANTLYVIKAA